MSKWSNDLELNLISLTSKKRPLPQFFEFKTNCKMFSRSEPKETYAVTNNFLQIKLKNISNDDFEKIAFNSCDCKTGCLDEEVFRKINNFVEKSYNIIDPERFNFRMLEQNKNRYNTYDKTESISDFKEILEWNIKSWNKSTDLNVASTNELSLLNKVKENLFKEGDILDRK
ncbi:hypothetical protein [Spiroplasma endosymbiont of Panorpa germanica]|uniref:hypothetical protein n=1 Tax=Spiroplasma endosymbiont of Panorpa germanica TaxID=3066314 RepID=UPI0030D2E8EB